MTAMFLAAELAAIPTEGELFGRPLSAPVRMPHAAGGTAARLVLALAPVAALVGLFVGF